MNIIIHIPKADMKFISIDFQSNNFTKLEFLERSFLKVKHNQILNVNIKFSN